MESRKEIPQITATASHRSTVLRMVREGRCASLGTSLVRAGASTPYVSLVTYATDYDGSPLLLLSELADHTQALAQTPQASLLIEQAHGLENPQTGPRVTILGQFHKLNRDDPGYASAEARFLARHPKAAQYAGFGDFSLWRMEVNEAHYVGGFARAVWLSNDWLPEAATAELFKSGVADVLDAFTREHLLSIAYGVAMNACCEASTDESVWRVVAVDCDGLVISEGDAGVPVWLPFETPLRTLEELAERFTALVKQGQQIALEQALERS